MPDDTPRDEDGVRDRLALTRTRLANERTMLAYVRTAIMLAVTGGTLLGLYGETAWTSVAGWILVAAGVLVVGMGAYRFYGLSDLLS